MRTLALGLLVSALSAGCGGSTEPDPALTLEARVAELPDVPVLGTDSTLDVGTWNLEWFGAPANGPSPEGRQLDNVWTLLDGLGVDLWAVQEVAGAAHFHDLVTQLAGYDGLLATDPRVTDGAAYYSDFDDGELKVGLLFAEGSVTVDSARVILTGYDHAFAGRPPVEVHLRVGSAPTELVVILVHAKAGAAAADRDRRAAASAALLTYLDAELPARPVLVIGDFNDDVDASITAGQPSPYANFVDAPGYAFTTAALSTAGESSTVTHSDMIDHHLAAAALAATYVEGTARVVAADALLSAYAESTSDHLPVVARYAPEGGAVPFTTGARRHVELVWSGADGTEVDVRRDGARIATTANDGRYVDSVEPDVTTAAYRVCEAGTDRCTDPVTVELGAAGL